MKQSLKGALLSGLVFPGLGHIILKRYKRGIALIVSLMAALAIIVALATQQALTVIEQIESQGGLIDMETISRTASQAGTATDSMIINLLFFFIVIGWIGGTIDAFLIGRKLDSQSPADNE